MKVIAFNGSPKAKGNTFQALSLVTGVLNEQGIETEIVHVGNKAISGCLACNGCAKNRDEKCVIKDDVNSWIAKIKDADGILLGAPVHFASVPGNMKSFLDRAFYVAARNNSMFRNKVAASLVTVRRSGGLPAFTQLNNFINYAEMIMPASNYWNVIYGTKPGDILEDAEGIQIMKILGENMAYTLKMQQKASIEAPKLQKKIYTNFIR